MGTDQRNKKDKGKAEMTAPILNNSDDRKLSIVNNTPAIFEFDPHINGMQSGDAPWYRIHAVGKYVVGLFDSTITEAAITFGVDLDLVKEIVYVENSQGYYDRTLSAAEVIPSDLPPEMPPFLS